MNVPEISFYCINHLKSLSVFIGMCYFWLDLICSSSCDAYLFNQWSAQSGLWFIFTTNLKIFLSVFWWSPKSNFYLKISESKKLGSKANRAFKATNQIILYFVSFPISPKLASEKYSFAVLEKMICRRVFLLWFS